MWTHRRGRADPDGVRCAECTDVTDDVADRHGEHHDDGVCQHEQKQVLKGFLRLEGQIARLAQDQLPFGAVFPGKKDRKSVV
jgi:hypothetical protein